MSIPEETQKYKDVVWDFLLEHSDILDSGSVFVKFHTSGRKNFENRVYARYKYGYHREDVVTKGQDQEEKRRDYELKKAVKKARYEERKKLSKKTNKIKKVYASIKTIIKRSWTTPETPANEKGD